MYPLLVACKSISNLRKAAAQEVVDKVRQHSGKLVDQVNLQTNEKGKDWQCGKVGNGSKWVDLGGPPNSFENFSLYAITRRLYVISDL